MHIIHVSSELSPFAKVGGLGDVVFGLSHELALSGHHVTCFLPYYDHLDLSSLRDLKIVKNCQIPQALGGPFEVCYWVGFLESIQVVLVDSLHSWNFFKRGKIYGEIDDALRFLHFCLLVIYGIEVLEFNPTCLHLHDWQASFIAPYLLEHPLPSQPKTLLTIHNMMHQGQASFEQLQELPEHIQSLIKKEHFQDPIHKATLNLLRAGIESCKVLTTVSTTYAKEIQTPDYGFHLYATVKKYRSKLLGIINGLDEHYWDPRHDAMLLKSFPKTQDAYLITQVKQLHKHHLKEFLGLDIAANRPLFCSITRLDYQKSPELIAHAAYHCAKEGYPYVILGAPSTSEIDHMFLNLQEKFRSKNLIIYYRGFHEAFAHKLFAAADFIVIPSRFEPCGLTQMIGMRYGAIPIVRRTGGLVDTVIDIQQDKSQATGLVFEELQPDAIDHVLRRAFTLYSNPSLMQQVRNHGMSKDFSWEKPAAAYFKIYRELSKG